MSWLVLVIAGVLEAIWAIALNESKFFTRLGPIVIFFVALALSMAGLAYAMREIGVGVAYAVWVGIGAALTFGYALATGQEAFTILKFALLLGLVGCVVGLKLVSDSH